MMFKCQLHNPDHDVHDGDTLLNVQIKILDYPEAEGDPVKVWPNVMVKNKAVYAVESVRLYGIDTAEMHPHHSDGHGNVRSEESLNMEKELAQKQRVALYKLLEQADFTFYIKDPLNGKYAGRVVAKVLVQDQQTKELIDASVYLVKNAGAHPYFGLKKKTWS